MPKKMPRRETDDSGRPAIRIRVRGSIAWDDWVKALAEVQGQSVTELIEDALAAVARRTRFRPPPPRT